MYREITMPPTATPRKPIISGSKKREHVLGGGVHFVFIEVCDLLQHCVHGAGGFTNSDHLRNHVGKHAAFLQRINNGPALFYRFANFHQRIF